MHILITGGTGFIGSKLCQHFISQGHKITVLTRKIINYPNLSKHIILIRDLNESTKPFDAIINLAGEPLNKKRWNQEVKTKIYNSRIKTTQKIINYIKDTAVKPKILISGSAIGFYGASNEEVFTEDSSPASTTVFSQKLCTDWEKEALKANKFGVKVCLIRIGIVLGAGGGVLRELVPIFKLGLGAKISDGNQIMSWIHIDDVIGVIDFILNHSEIPQIVNLTSPNPISNKTFSTSLANVLNRACIFSIPSIIVKLLYGQMGEELLLQGQSVIPKKITELGYKFKHPEIKEALDSLLNTEK